MTGSWDSFFMALVGASAALTGLVFVALSINLARILEYPPLVGRAGEAVILLVQPLLVGLAVLVPDVAVRTTGVLCAVVVFADFGLVNRFVLQGRVAARGRPRHEFRTRVTVVESAMLPAVVGVILLLCGSSSGVYWIALGAVAHLVVGVFDGWILLIEILR